MLQPNWSPVCPQEGPGHPLAPSIPQESTMTPCQTTTRMSAYFLTWSPTVVCPDWQRFLGDLLLYRGICWSVKKKKYGEFPVTDYPSLAIPKTFRELSPWWRKIDTLCFALLTMAKPGCSFRPLASFREVIAKGAYGVG